MQTPILFLILLVVALLTPPRNSQKLYDIGNIPADDEQAYLTLFAGALNKNRINASAKTRHRECSEIELWLMPNRSQD